jgi:hypothetical protein
MTGGEMQQMIATAYGAPKPVAERAGALMKPKGMAKAPKSKHVPKG